MIIHHRLIFVVIRNIEKEQFNNLKFLITMKKYIGTKQVEAEPMTMGEAYKRNLLQAYRVPNDSEKDNPGFYVRYQDGYESWSPAETFNKAYKLADTPLDRMIIEHKELGEKINKLEKFLFRLNFDIKESEKITSEMRTLLDMQCRAMKEYYNILKERIENM